LRNEGRLLSWRWLLRSAAGSFFSSGTLGSF
jgi:hypothetical protein